MRAEPIFVKDPKQRTGSAALLFERLVDHNSDTNEDASSSVMLDKHDTTKSIMNEVSRILNTYLGARKEVYNDALKDKTLGATPELFGMRDIVSFDPASKVEWKRIEKYCAKAIESFEPRLKNVRVQVSYFDKLYQKLYINLSAEFNLTVFEGRVNFPTELSYGWVR